MESNLAVLIDFENIAAGTEKEGFGRFDIQLLMERLKDKGRVLITRAYADWGRFSRFKQNLLAANITMMELPSHGMQGKNRADIAMVVDALEIAFTKDYIDTFVVLSGDSDFTPMVLKLRELNRRVIGCGLRQSTSRLLVQACDEYLFYDSLVHAKRQNERRREQKKSKAPARAERPSTDEPAPDKEEAFHLLASAVDGLQREHPDPQLASVVKSAMMRKSPDFSESDYGCSTFARFLEAAHKAGHVKIVRDPKSGGYRVDSADSTADVGPIEEEAEARPRGAEAWSDPYLPDGVNQWVGKLSSKGVNPLASPSRMAILEAFVAVVRERVERKRKVNVQFVQDDVKKRIKKLRPDVPPRAVKAVFNALMRADILIHPDGNPVRSASAPFAIQRDALEINKALATVYLRVLYDTGAKLDDLALLSQLLFGVRDRQKEIGETLAWIATGGTEDEEDGDEIDLDALLSFDEDEGQGDEVEDDEAATPSRRRRRRKWEQDREAAAEDEPVAVEEAAAEPPEDDGGAEPEAPVEAEPAAEVPVVEDLPEVPSSTEELDALLTSD